MKTKILIAGVLGALMLFSLLATADYSGDHPLTAYDRGMTYGDLVYVTVEDGTGYKTLDADGSNTMEQNIEINIPEGATIITARLYNYVSWSTSDYRDGNIPGDPAEAKLTFNGIEVVCQNPDPITNPIDYGNGVVQYWDSKGQGYSSTSYDFPSGTFAWDVTDLVTGSGTYFATITNADSTPTVKPGDPYAEPPKPDVPESFTTYGFGLLVVYDIDPVGPQPIKRQYWIMEGADMLKGDGTYETPEDATTSAFFGGGVPKFNFDPSDRPAELTTVVVSSDKGGYVPPLNMVSFNGEEFGPSIAINDKAIGVNTFDVTWYLQKTGNIAEIQDRGDYMVASNAFLVVTYP